MPTTTAGPLVAKLVTAYHVEECSPLDDDEYHTAYPDDEDCDVDNTNASDRAVVEGADEIHHLWHVEILADGELLHLEYSSCLEIWRLEDGQSNQERWNSLASRYGESSLRCAINEALDSPLWPGCNY